MVLSSWSNVFRGEIKQWRERLVYQLLLLTRLGDRVNALVNKGLQPQSCRGTPSAVLTSVMLQGSPVWTAAVSTQLPSSSYRHWERSAVELVYWEETVSPPANMPVDRRLITLLRALQTHTDEQDTPRYLEGFSRIYTRILIYMLIASSQQLPIFSPPFQTH